MYYKYLYYIYIYIHDICIQRYAYIRSKYVFSILYGSASYHSLSPPPPSPFLSSSLFCLFFFFWLGLFTYYCLANVSLGCI